MRKNSEHMFIHNVLGGSLLHGLTLCKYVSMPVEPSRLQKPILFLTECGLVDTRMEVMELYLKSVQFTIICQVM